MSAGPANAVREAAAGAPQIAGSAVVLGSARMGEGSLLAEGAVIRSEGGHVDIGAGSAVLENSVVVGTTTIPAVIGRRTVFGHRCKVIGATSPQRRARGGRRAHPNRSTGLIAEPAIAIVA